VNKLIKIQRNHPLSLPSRAQYPVLNMNAQTTVETTPTPSHQRRRTIVSIILLIYSLGLTIVIATFVHALLPHLLYRALAWGALSFVWMGACTLSEWGNDWHLIKLVLHRLQCHRHPHCAPNPRPSPNESFVLYMHIKNMAWNPTIRHVNTWPNGHEI
jgi:hypothetical protein